MTVFWSLAAAMSLLALLFVVLPLIRHRPSREVELDELNAEVARTRLAELEAELESGRIEQAQYDSDREDLERELLYDLTGNVSTRPVRSGLWAAVVIAIAVPAGAALLYKNIGSERIITLLQDFPAGQPARQATQPKLSVDEMISRLAARLEQDPDDLTGWTMLAKSYSVMSRYDEAVHAFRNIMRLGGGDNAAMLADFADALAASNNGMFPDEAGTLLGRAVELEQDNVKALWLAGHWQNQQGDAAAAVGYWERAARLIPADSKDGQVIREQIADVRAQGGLPAGTATVQQTADASAAPGDGQPAHRAGGALPVTVELDPALQAQVRPDDNGFIFARAVNGPRMPLAIVRKQAVELPVTVTLDDSMAMSPAMVLSGFDPVSIGARISRSGNAMPQSGDLQGMQSPVSTGTSTSLNVRIDSTVP